jgi:hypothetical protein
MYQQETRTFLVSTATIPSGREPAGTCRGLPVWFSIEETSVAAMA